MPTRGQCPAGARAGPAVDSHAYDEISLLDADREGFRNIGAFDQPCAGLDVDLEVAQLDAAGIAPRLAGADVVFPGMPGAADHLASAAVAVFAGHLGFHEAGDDALRQRATLVRAAV